MNSASESGSAQARRELRSQGWYHGTNKEAFIHRSWMRRGLPDDAFDGRPMIGIANSASDLAPCNMNLVEVAEHVKRGVWEAGGVPVEFPVMSLGETQIRPTAMLFRNLMAMTVEESIRANPIDGVVLLCGCDKTTPAMVMGACSADLPSVVVSSGAMLGGSFQGRRIGAGADIWRFSEDLRAGTMTPNEFQSAEACMTRSKGTCNNMGTASTMACLVETMGLSLPDNATWPAADTRRLALAHATGRHAVEMALEDRRPSHVLTRASFLNAIRVLAAIGGSTNAVLHLLAIAGRVGIDLHLNDFDDHGSAIPLLANLQPAGDHLMEDFADAGGLPALLATLGDELDGSAQTVLGRPIATYWDGREVFRPEVIASLEKPFAKEAGIVVLRGNLAPDGAVIKPAAATADLLVHTGPALVFESVDDLHQRIDDPHLAVTPNTVLVLRNSGPRGYPGMPEVGNLPIPIRLVEAGVRDMVRLSDARMSGTAFGTVVLHISPESAHGGPLAYVRTGDRITLDVPNRRIDVDVSDAELKARAARHAGATLSEDRGWVGLYKAHVEQANVGCDLDFLRGATESGVPRSSH